MDVLSIFALNSCLTVCKAFKMATKGHVTIFIIVGSNENFIHEQHSVKVSQR